MDILYVYGNCNKCDDFELKCSLRSIAKYGKNVDRIFIVGYCPDWLSNNVIKIPYDIDYSLPKNKNIYTQILHAINNSDIGVNNNGDFLISMDDHFYLKDTDFNNYPIYIKDYKKRKYRYNLPFEVEESYGHVGYQQILVNTYEVCVNNNLLTLNCVPHRNTHLNRYKVLEMNEINDYIINRDTPEIEGLCVAINYSLTYYPQKFEIIKDFKSDNIQRICYDILVNNIDVFSINKCELNSVMYNFLNDLYPFKCKYEK